MTRLENVRNSLQETHASLDGLLEAGVQIAKGFDIGFFGEKSHVHFHCTMGVIKSMNGFLLQHSSFLTPSQLATCIGQVERQKKAVAISNAMESFTVSHISSPAFKSLQAKIGCKLHAFTKKIGPVSLAKITSLFLMHYTLF